MLDVFLDSLIDSAKVLGIAFIIYVSLSFIETSFSSFLQKSRKLSPLIGASVGLIPQCGFSVVSADLYIKGHISTGTILAIFIACSDEALPILLSDFSQAWMLGLMIICKFILALIVGYSFDLLFPRSMRHKEEHLKECEHVRENHVGCCHHHIDDEEEGKWHKHLVHPLLHSLKIFLYVFVINFIFGWIIYSVGEENFTSFLAMNKYVAPIYACLVGLIPNCASSVMLTELLLGGQLSFGACFSGLVVNAGLGLWVLLKDFKEWKKTALIVAVLVIVGLASGYLLCAIIGF